MEPVGDARASYGSRSHCVLIFLPMTMLADHAFTDRRKVKLGHVTKQMGSLHALLTLLVLAQAVASAEQSVGGHLDLQVESDASDEMPDEDSELQSRIPAFFFFLHHAIMTTASKESEKQDQVGRQTASCSCKTGLQPRAVPERA